jgi:hypothetical protein
MSVPGSTSQPECYKVTPSATIIIILILVSIPRNTREASVSNIHSRDILHKVLLPAGAREPQVPGDDVSLDRVADVAGVADGRDDVLALFESRVDARPPECLVGVEGLLHGVGLALFDPARQATREEDSVFEDDAGGLALGWHGVLRGGC